MTKEDKKYDVALSFAGEDRSSAEAVAEALKGRADRAADPTKPASPQIAAKVTGTKEGENIKVETIEVQ